MSDLESAKFEKIGRQAMNIQVIEATFAAANSDGEAIEGTERLTAFVYNLEKITPEEVEKALNDGDYMYDTRILEADPERLANIFPHRGESKIDCPPAYWNPINAYHCRCSVCGCRVHITDAIGQKEYNPDLPPYYRYCPRCGSTMGKKGDQTNG